MTVRLVISVLLGLGAAVLFGSAYVPWLRKIKAGQEIKDIGPNWHKSKAGTPTMGGVIFIVAAVTVLFTAGFSFLREGERAAVLVLLLALVYGSIGFLDDYEKLKKKQNLGLSARAKFLLQLLAAVVILYWLRREGYLSPALYIPFWHRTIWLPEWLYYVLSAFIMVGTVNSVNITDGIDGLAGSVCVPVFVCYTALCVAWGSHFRSLAVFCAGLTGGLFGFLLFNFHPAKCFMGDTGSLFLGGAVCGMAFALDVPLILIPLGLVFILETLSDIIQVTYFKLTHGKRFFKMAPFHHHLEMGGWFGHKWTEVQIVTLFTSISVISAVIAFLGTVGRYSVG